MSTQDKKPVQLSFSDPGVRHPPGWAMVAVREDKVIALRYVPEKVRGLKTAKRDVVAWMATADAGRHFRELAVFGQVKIGVCYREKFWVQ